MTNFIKNNLKTILIIEVIAIIGISGYIFASYQYLASQVEYKNGKSVENALNELYKKSDILWKNEYPENEFDAQTINLNLNEYKGILILGIYGIDYSNVCSYKYIEVGKTSNIEIGYAYNAKDIAYRAITVNNIGVQIGEGKNKSKSETYSNSCRAIPMYIIGVK